MPVVSVHLPARTSTCAVYGNGHALPDRDGQRQRRHVDGEARRRVRQQRDVGDLDREVGAVVDELERRGRRAPIVVTNEITVGSSLMSFGSRQDGTPGVISDWKSAGGSWAML
jgi:hypothetical protein